MDTLIRGFVLILPLALLLTAGNLLFRKGFITPGDIATLSKFLFWIISPSLLFRNAFQINENMRTQTSFFWPVVCSALLAMLAAYAAERWLFRVKDRRRVALTTAAAMRPNTIYVGLPTVQTVIGNQAIGLLALYIAVAMPRYNLLSPLSSELILARRGEMRGFLKNAVKSILKNPMVMSPVCGILLVSLGMKTLPPTLDKSLQMVGNAATGMALLTLGASIEVGRAKKAFASCWREVLMRLFIHPAILYCCLNAAGVDAALKNVAVLVTATPTAVTLFVLAKGIGLDGSRAAEITVLTTLLSAVTIPMWIAFLGI